MRPVTKVILVLSVVALAVGVIWFVTYKWSGIRSSEPAKTAPQVVDTQRPGYNDPLTTYQRWRQSFVGRSDQAAPPPGDVARPPARTDDLHSSSENEGTVIARRSEEPVAGADPPGPALGPLGPALNPSRITGEEMPPGFKARDNASGNSYTIAAGDTLYGIAMKFYGDPRYASNIEAANQGINPKALKVGDRIMLPERNMVARPDERTATSVGPAAPGSPSAKVYVVQKNDTLIGIARRVYGDSTMYRKVYEANQDILSSPNATLHVGQRLRLPE
jgi:nucleoid-associated protein YgaU